MLAWGKGGWLEDPRVFHIFVIIGTIVRRGGWMWLLVVWVMLLVLCLGVWHELVVGLGVYDMVMLWDWSLDLGGLTTNLVESMNFVFKGIWNLPITVLVIATYFRLGSLFEIGCSKWSSVLQSGQLFSDASMKFIEETAKDLHMWSQCLTVIKVDSVLPSQWTTIKGGRWDTIKWN